MIELPLKQSPRAIGEYRAPDWKDAPREKAAPKPIAPRSPKKRKELATWAAVTRRAIYAVKGVCQKCKDPRCKATVGHHVKLQSQGGPDTIENCLPVSVKCHSEIHDHVAKSVARGWIIQGGTTK